MQEFSFNSQVSTFFELDSNSGEVRIRVPLYNEINDIDEYRFNVVARDGGQRSTTSATVIINVIRNKFTPQFVGTPYTTVIPFTVGGGFTVFSVNATDADADVSNDGRNICECFILMPRFFHDIYESLKYKIIHLVP